MRIAVIDDKKEELEKARAAVEVRGHEFKGILADGSIKRHLSFIFWDSDAVITDLHFIPFDREYDGKESPTWKQYENNEPPAGLLVAMYALGMGKPVVICTSIQHHSKAASWIYDGFITHMADRAPFGWVDSKDWSEAVEKVIRWADDL